MGMAFVSDKVKRLPPYLFSEFQRRKRELQDEGVDVIDLGIGAPDLATPPFIIERLAAEMINPLNHRYSAYNGCQEFREAVADFYQRRYQVELDPDEEVLALIGTKEGITNFVQAIIDPGDAVLVPNPGYPVYRTAVHLAGGTIIDLPLDAKNGYRPQFNRLSLESKQKSKLMFLNYPSNPTAATVELKTFLEAITFCVENNIFLANDMAYDLITFDDYTSPSVMQVPNAKDYAVEFGSLSKSFNMTGWRIGYVVGNKAAIKALSTLKSNIDTSQFLPIQKAAATALRSDLSATKHHSDIFQKRMEKLYTALRDIGMEVEKPKGTIFLWCKVPAGYTSVHFANLLLEEAGIIVTPGTAFGSAGDGYIRISLSVKSDRLEEVITRFKKLSLKERNM